MKPFITFTFFVLVFLSAGVAADRPARKLAFEKDDAIWVSNIDGSKPKKIARGQSPELSPDGTRLAYNTVQAIGHPAHRKIAIVDLPTKKTTVFNNIPSDNCMDPRWSLDSKQLIFAYYSNNERMLGFVNPDGTGFHSLPEHGKHQTYWAAAWAADGKSFFAEDMKNIYRIGVQGKDLKLLVKNARTPSTSR